MIDFPKILDAILSCRSEKPILCFLWDGSCAFGNNIWLIDQQRRERRREEEKEEEGSGKGGGEVMIYSIIFTFSNNWEF